MKIFCKQGTGNTAVWKLLLFLALIPAVLAGCASTENLSVEDREVIGMNMTYFDGQIDVSIHGGVFLTQGEPLSFTASAQTLSEIVVPQWKIEPQGAAEIVERHQEGNSSQVLLKADAPAKLKLIAYAGTQQAVANIQVHVTKQQFDAMVERASALPEKKERKKLLRRAEKLDEPGEEMTELYYELEEACQ